MVQCRVNKLSDWINEKNKFDGVSMVRLVYNGQAHDYTRWKFSGQNIFFFHDDMKVGHILWTTDQVLRRLLPLGAQEEWRDPSGNVVLAMLV